MSKEVYIADNLSNKKAQALGRATSLIDHPLPLHYNENRDPISCSKIDGFWRLILLLLAGIAGLSSGFLVWLIASHWIASSITWVEDRHPELAGSKRLRAYEAVACGALFAGCLALAFLIMRLLWTQVK